jgi:hypothetical protein
LTASSTGGASLSKGAQAGIGIGVVALVIGLAILGALLYLHRQRQRVLATGRGAGPYAAGSDEPEFAGVVRETPPYHYSGVVTSPAPYAAGSDASEVAGVVREKPPYHHSGAVASQGLYAAGSDAPEVASSDAPEVASFVRETPPYHHSGAVASPASAGPLFAEAFYAPPPSEMPVAPYAQASELTGSAPGDIHRQAEIPTQPVIPTQIVGEGDRSEDGVRKRLSRAREEREALARIVELNRLEEQLESRLANSG